MATQGAWRLTGERTGGDGSDLYAHRARPVLAMVAILWALAWGPVGAERGAPLTYEGFMGEALTCFAPDPRGRFVPVEPILDGSAPAAAMAQWDEMGNPLIVFNPALLEEHAARWHPVVPRFLYYRQCARLRLIEPSEIQLTCDAILQMRGEGTISPQEEKILTEFHYSIGWRGYEFGGTGSQHWQMAMSCVGSRW